MMLRNATANWPDTHCLANDIFNAISGVTIKPWRPCFAMPACNSSAYSMKATFLPLIKRASWKPGYCLKSIVSIISLTSGGKPSTKSTFDGCPSLSAASFFSAAAPGGGTVLGADAFAFVSDPLSLIAARALLKDFTPSATEDLPGGALGFTGSSTIFTPNFARGLKVPSSIATTSDLDFEYVIFMGLSRKTKPCKALIAFVAQDMSLNTTKACPFFLRVPKATTSMTSPYALKSSVRQHFSSAILIF